MDSILEELFYGNICPDIDCRRSDKARKQLRSDIAEHYDHLQDMLNTQQKEVLEKFDNSFSEMMMKNERDIFVYAFKLGAQIMLSVMSE